MPLSFRTLQGLSVQDFFAHIHVFVQDFTDILLTRVKCKVKISDICGNIDTFANIF